MKVTLTKQNVMNEQIIVEIDVPTCEGAEKDWNREVKPVIDMLDRRMYELNLRAIKADAEIRKLPKQEFSVMRNVLQGLSGMPLPAFRERDMKGEQIGASE